MYKYLVFTQDSVIFRLMDSVVMQSIKVLIHAMLKVLLQIWIIMDYK